ncbi:MAG: holin [Thermomicrobiales bacterium]
MKTETIEALGAASSKITAAGAVTSFWGWLTSSATLGLLGVLVALCGTLVSSYYRRKADQRHEAEAEQKRRERDLRMELMRATGRPIFTHDTDLGALEADE